LRRCTSCWRARRRMYCGDPDGGGDEADGGGGRCLCAGYSERSVERMNARNGYRARPWVRTIDLALPKLRQGTYFPGWLPEPRQRGSGRGTGGRFRLRPADPRCGRLDGKQLTRAWLGKHTSRTPPLGRHHE